MADEMQESVAREVTFNGEQSDEVEALLGDHFGGWTEGGVVIHWPDGFEATAKAGDTIRRTPADAIEIWHA